MKKLSSNSKEVKEKIQSYIKDCLCEDAHDLKSQLQYALNDFKNWYSPYEKRRTPNRQNAFQEFLMCLPSSISVDYYYYNIREILNYWLGDTNANISKYSDDELLQRFCALIYREFIKLCEKEGINLNG